MQETHTRTQVWTPEAVTPATEVIFGGEGTCWVHQPFLGLLSGLVRGGLWIPDSTCPAGHMGQWASEPQQPMAIAVGTAQNTEEMARLGVGRQM